MTIALPARAKLNLDLKVTGARSDGMHELRTHMVAVELHDTLEVELADETSIEITGLPMSEHKPNSVLTAHAAVELVAERRLPTRFRLHKRIPPGSGLGGASSDAAAALRALKAVHGLTVDLGPMAKRVGADVSFFLTGGQALVEGVGERITPEPEHQMWFALAWPGVELSTALVYRAWDEVQGDGANELGRAAFRVDPSIEKFAAALGEGWQMTGSGSAFFLRCRDRESAESAVSRLECWTSVTHSIGAWA